MISNGCEICLLLRKFILNNRYLTLLAKITSDGELVSCETIKTSSGIRGLDNCPKNCFKTSDATWASTWSCAHTLLFALKSLAWISYAWRKFAVSSEGSEFLKHKYNHKTKMKQQYLTWNFLLFKRIYEKLFFSI